MAENSKIEWTNHTANLWHGCTKVTAGCDHCYAETLSKRWGHDIWGNDKPRKEIYSFDKDLIRYQKLAEEAGEIHRVFVGSMMDIFEKPMPLLKKDGRISTTYNTGTLRKIFFDSITDGYYDNLMFLFLTKRPSNINKYIPESWKENPPANVMFGTSPCDQETFKKLVEQLCEVNGKRFLSMEPQLERINIADTKYGYDIGKYIHWIIQGGESGHHKRPFDIDWAYNTLYQCSKLNIPYFFKQIDKVQEIPDDLKIRQFPKL